MAVAQANTDLGVETVMFFNGTISVFEGHEPDPGLGLMAGSMSSIK